MSNTRYPKQCYYMLRRLDEICRNTWATKIKHLLHENGFWFVWISDGVGDSSQFLKIFRQHLIDSSLQVLQRKIVDSSKANYYKYFKSLLNTERYLSIDMSLNNRRILSNFRCSSHCLNIVKGRHKKIDHNLRFCDLCLERNIHVVEDEFHFLMVCPAHDDLRTLYFHAKWKSSYPTKELFTEIMADPRPMCIKSLAKCLVESFKIRKLSYIWKIL